MHLIIHLSAVLQTQHLKKHSAFSAEQSPLKVFGIAKNEMDDVAAALTKTEVFMQAFKKLAASAAGEGFEEYTEQILQPVIENIAYAGQAGYNSVENPFKLSTPEAWYSALVGSVSGGLFEGAGLVPNGKKSKVDTNLDTKTDIKTERLASKNDDVQLKVDTISQGGMEAEMNAQGDGNAESSLNTQSGETVKNTPRFTDNEIKTFTPDELNTYADSINNEYVQHLKDTTTFTEEQIQTYLDEAGKDTSPEGRASQAYKQQMEMDAWVKNNQNSNENSSVDDNSSEKSDKVVSQEESYFNQDGTIDQKMIPKKELGETDIKKLIDSKVAFTKEQIENMSEDQLSTTLDLMTPDFIAETKNNTAFSKVPQMIEAAKSSGNIRDMRNYVKMYQAQLMNINQVQNARVTNENELKIEKNRDNINKSSTVQIPKNSIDFIEFVKSAKADEISKAIDTFSFDNVKGKDIQIILDNIGDSDKLSNQEKFDLQHKIYRNAKDLTDIQVIRDIAFVDENYRIKYPLNDGFKVDVNGVVDRNPFNILKDMIVDRFGLSNGRFVCPIENGNVYNHNQRSLPHLENPKAYHKYKVVKDFSQLSDAIENCKDIDLKMAIKHYISGKSKENINTYIGQIAPAFNCDGGGIQIEMPIPIEFLKALKFLEEIR